MGWTSPLLGEPFQCQLHIQGNQQDTGCSTRVLIWARFRLWSPFKVFFMPLEDRFYMLRASRTSLSGSLTDVASQIASSSLVSPARIQQRDSDSDSG